MVWSMQTLPTIGQDFPPISTRPWLDQRRFTPSAYPAGNVAIQVSSGAIQVRPYPIDVPLVTFLRNETRVWSDMPGRNGIVWGVSFEG
ncbi:MAG: hypothetical protein BWY66_00945 [bacterium ADurb.Bin374]|nr:MAG: hypothetical protein BWY66_00945 [bacterium ADurb.Bin374]